METAETKTLVWHKNENPKPAFTHILLRGVCKATKKFTYYTALWIDEVGIPTNFYIGGNELNADLIFVDGQFEWLDLDDINGSGTCFL